LDDESLKIVTSRNMVFNENVMYKDTLKDSSEGIDKSVEELHVEIKEGIKGVQKPRYKARLVSRGFTQKAGVDYNEVVSSVVRHTSIRVTLALIACRDYEPTHLDVKTTFLHENLEEQSPRSYAPGEYIYVLLYVDDMLNACKSKAEIGSTKSLLKKEFDIKYVSKVLHKFRMDNGKPVQMPLGWHFKLSLKDCPFRDCDVKRMSKVPYLANLGKNHWEALKWILRYLRGTANVGLVYGTYRENHVDVTGFVDLDYTKDPDKEAEYMALTEAVKEAIWLRGLMEDLGVELNTVALRQLIVLEATCSEGGYLNTKHVDAIRQSSISGLKRRNERNGSPQPYWDHCHERPDKSKDTSHRVIIPTTVCDGANTMKILPSLCDKNSHDNEKKSILGLTLKNKQEKSKNARRFSTQQCWTLSTRSHTEAERIRTTSDTYSPKHKTLSGPTGQNLGIILIVSPPHRQGSLLVEIRPEQRPLPRSIKTYGTPREYGSMSYLQKHKTDTKDLKAASSYLFYAAKKKVSQGKDGGLEGLPPYKNTQRNPRSRSRKVQTTTTHVKKHIKELMRAGKLSHLIKEIKQGRDQSKVGKK
ncbi:retrotransposon protein, putative, ty1-copia subclass, partial [Tanacetum coccineum]